MSQAAYVKSHSQCGYIEIEFYSPKANSMPLALLEELANQIERAGQDSSNHSILIKSSGDKTFCSGASFDELAALQNIEQGTKFFSGFAKVILAIVNCPIFVLGRAQGRSVGGGVGILAACDYVLAHESAAIALTELKLGLGPYVIGPAVERKIGWANFQELALEAEFKTASWCKDKGFYQEVYANVQDLDLKCTERLERWATFDRAAIEQFKTTCNLDKASWSMLLHERAKKSAELTLSNAVQNRIRPQVLSK